MAKYNRSKSTDFTSSSGAVAYSALRKEVGIAIPAKSLMVITELEDGDTVEFDFGSDTLTGGEQTTLTTVCNDHTAPARERILSTMPASGLEVTVTTDGSWTVLHYQVIDPETLHGDLTKVFARFVAAVKVDDGAGSELPEFRIVERKVSDDVEVILMTAVHQPADTGTAFRSMQFDSDVDPRSGLMEYRVEVDRNSATECVIRGASFMLCASV